MLKATVHINKHRRKIKITSR